MTQVKASILCLTSALFGVIKNGVRYFAWVGHVGIIRLFRRRHGIVNELIVRRRIAIPVMRRPATEMLYLIRGDITVNILFVVLARGLRNGGACRMGRRGGSRQYASCVFPLLRVVVSFRCFFLLVTSTRGVRVVIVRTSIGVFGGGANELGGRGMSVADGVMRGGGMRGGVCQGGNRGPVLLVPNSGSSALSQDIAGHGANSHVGTDAITTTTFVPKILPGVSAIGPGEGTRVVEALQLAPRLCFGVG